MVGVVADLDPRLELDTGALSLRSALHDEASIDEIGLAGRSDDADIDLSPGWMCANGDESSAR